MCCRILSDHISKLSSQISVGHRDLRIPTIYHYECPWPAAQADIFTISAYKVCYSDMEEAQLVFLCPVFTSFYTFILEIVYVLFTLQTPRDKVACMTRCSTTIMNLLSLAIDKSVPGADDFMPVLIYVIIKGLYVIGSNPASR